MTSPHLFHLNELKPQDQSEGGVRTRVTRKNFPILNGMSLYKLVLHPLGVREPHWHPNADELGFCLSGKVLITFYGNENATETFLVQEGEVFLIPSGFLHHIENVSSKESTLILQFSHEEPEDFGLSAALGFQTDAVLGNTWNVSETVFKPLKRSTHPKFASLLKSPSKTAENSPNSPYKYGLSNNDPLIHTEDGWARVARHDVWPMVQRQALYLLFLKNTGMREPHWHPSTAELGYVDKGKGRMSILNPSGKVDTYEMNAGDIYFIPKAYPHHIENLGKELHILIFFDAAMPGDIGYTGSVRAFSNDVLGATMNISPSFFDHLKKYKEDLFIVKRINPL